MRINQKITYPGIGKPRKISENLGVCHLKGSHREVGFQYGQAFSKDLVKFNDYLKSLLAESAGKFLSRLVYYVALPFYSLLQWCRIPKLLRQEMKGIAEGAEDLSRFNTIRMMKMVRLSSLYDFMVNFALVGVGCSSFAQRGEGGKLFVGRNFDFNFDPTDNTAKPLEDKPLERSQVILYEIEDQQPFISTGPIFFNAAPTTAIIEGENGEPLFFAIHNVIGPRKFFGKPTFVLLREMANKAKFEDIRQLLEGSKETCAKKFIFTDSTRAAIADAVPDIGIMIKEMGKDEASLAVTNHFQTKKSKKYESPTEEDHGLNFNSRVRLFSIRQFLSGIIKPSIETVISALSNTYDHTLNLVRPWGHVTSPPFRNDQRPPYAANINRAFYSIAIDYIKGRFFVGAGEYAPFGTYHGFNFKNIWRWAREGEELQVEARPQAIDKDLLDKALDCAKALANAKYHYKKGNLNRARFHLQEVRKIDSKDIESQLLLSVIFLEKSSHANSSYANSAMDRLRNIIKIEEDQKVLPKLRAGSAFAHLLLGMIYDTRGNREKALEQYDRVLEFEKANEFGAEASEVAKRYLGKPCKHLPSHRKMAKLIL